MAVVTRPGKIFVGIFLVSICSIIFGWQLHPASIELFVQLPLALRLTKNETVSLAAYRSDDTLSYNDRNCSSPEYNVSWPLSGSKASLTSSLTCGADSSSRLSNFFKTLAVSLDEQFSEKCHSAIRFGVAFGGSHVSELKKQATRNPPLSCAIMFVLEDERPVPARSAIKSFGQENLIGIPRNILPFKNQRRNVKLIKLHGHLLFPFAQVLIWQDVKLRHVAPRPASFYIDFLESREFHNDNSSATSCLATMGLPIHPFTFGKQFARMKRYMPNYQHHCDTVVRAIEERPDVTDSTDTLLQQCRLYQSFNASDNGISLNRGLIDSAFLVWNHATPKCRDFNERLACTWSDEINCHSDRDQISFPYVLRQVGLTESTISRGRSGTDNDIYLMNDKNDLLVRVVKSSCHWYSGKFPRACLEA